MKKAFYNLRNKTVQLEIKLKKQNLDHPLCIDLKSDHILLKLFHVVEETCENNNNSENTPSQEIALIYHQILI